jgi:hypothetical protein
VGRNRKARAPFRSGVEGLLARGSRDLPGDAVRAESLHAARWIEAFLAPTYGPHGSAKLVDGPDPQWLTSGASALREIPGSHPALDPYRSLARAVQEHQGDGATTAVLLAARLVRRALDAPGLRPAAALSGYMLAARQSLAALGASARSASPEAVLRSAARTPEAAERIIAGIPRDGAFELDMVDVRAEDVAGPTWLDGLVINPEAGPGPALVEGGVLLLESAWKPGLRSEGSAYRFRSPKEYAEGHAREATRAREGVQRIRDLGVRIVLSTSSIEDTVKDALSSHAILVQTDTPASSLWRAARATGARPTPQPTSAQASDVGRGRAVRRDEGEGWLLAGPGPAFTLAMPAHNATAHAAAKDEGERLLRAAGRILEDPRAVPGGGAWQRAVADSLSKAAAAAPGKAPLALRCAADAFHDLATDLVRNAGRDPLVGPVSGPEVADPFPIVRHAVAAAFETARQLLRLDGRYDKRPSSTVGLRGRGSPKSLRGMAGDVPPLM